MNNQTDVSIRFSNSVTGEKKLEKYAQTLTTIKAVMNGINTGVGKELEKSASNTKDISNDVSTMSNITKLAFNYTTVREFSRMLSRTVSEMTRLITKSTEYLENINLYQVAFDGNYESADRFIDKMTEMYGLDESWLTRTVGIFKQLANAMNVSAETGEKLSTLLTQMSLDISSLYNVDMERASSVLQSAMAGQTKPIRGLTGGDITQATLQTTLDTLGIEKAVSELSFAEKRLLIVISLTQQLNASIGDMGRTIESPANQMRVLNSQWERLSRAVGNMFMPILAEVLPYLNAIMMVLTEIVSLVAGLFGYKEGDFDYFAGTSDSVIELEDNLNGATDSAKKLKQGLRGFDKLNVINTPTSSSVGASGGLDADILDAFNSAFDDYQDALDDVQMKATRIRDAILDWLGFSDGTYKNLKLIGGILGTIVGFKLIKGIAGLITGTSTLGKLLGTGGLFKILKKLIEPIKVLGGKDGLAYIFLTAKDAIKKFMPFIKGAGGVFGLISGGIGIFKQFDDAVQGLEVSTGKTALNVASMVGGGAAIGSIFGPAGTIIGALAGGFLSLATAVKASNDAMTQMAEDNLFGDINISTEEWRGILENSIGTITNFDEKAKEHKDALSNLNSTYQSARDELDLYGIKFGMLSQQISEKDAINIKNAIDDMTSSTAQMIQENTDYYLDLWSTSFEGITSVTEEEQKNILQSIVDRGSEQQTELQNAQSKITSIYDNAIKTRGYLTDEEYAEIKTQLQKIKELTIQETTANQAKFLAMKEGYNSDSLELDKESYQNYQKAADEYYKDSQESLAAALAEELNMVGITEEQKKTAYKVYNEKIKALDDEMTKHKDEFTQSLIKKYQSLTGKTDEQSKEQRKILEGLFKELDVPTEDYEAKVCKGSKKILKTINNELINPLNSYSPTIKIKADNSQALSSINAVEQRINKIANGSYSGVNYSYSPPSFNVSAHADGGMPPVGQLFIANEKGPELVGQIGGKSFVANQNQMMDLLDKKIGNAQSRNNPQVFNIYLDKDHKLGTYTLEQLQEMSKTNGKPVFG